MMPDYCVDTPSGTFPATEDLVPIHLDLLPILKKVIDGLNKRTDILFRAKSV